MTTTTTCMIIPPIIGGPNTLMPRWMESILSWMLALSCLGVAMWYYYLEHYSFTLQVHFSSLQLLLSSVYRSTISLLRRSLHFGLSLITIPATLVEVEKNDEENDDVDDDDQHQQLIPLTTHSRREWSTVSESYEGYKKRYEQLIKIIQCEMVFDQKKKSDNNDNDNDDDVNDKKNNEKKEQLSDWLKYSPTVIGNTDDYDDDNNNLDDTYYEPLVKLIRTNEVARRLTSLLLGTDPIDNYVHHLPTNTNIYTNKYTPSSHSKSNSNSSSSTSSSLSLSNSKSLSDYSNSLKKKEWRSRLCTTTTIPTINTTASSQEEKGNKVEAGQQNSNNNKTSPLLLLRILQHIWPKLLQLPPPSSSSSLYCGGGSGSTNFDENDSNSNDIDCYNYKYEITLIVPSYKENPKILASKLSKSLDNTSLDPTKIEIIIVHVIENNNNNDDDDDDDDDNNDNNNDANTIMCSTEIFKQDLLSSSSTLSLSLTVLKYKDGGGRGPCLNYGALHAKGRILTFLHADTKLNTKGWDIAIVNAFNNNNNNDDGRDDYDTTSPTHTTTHITTTSTTTSINNTNTNNTIGPRARTICCAFSFAIDTSKEALRMMINNNRDDDNNNNDDANYYYYSPPGIKAIEITANIRSRIFSLPYGDQCISIPSNIFHYIGCYPDQCLLEDYELIRLLRLRTSYSKNHSNRQNNKNNNNKDDDDDKTKVYVARDEEEKIKILSNEYEAICSPRRWQKYGVLYTTYTNSYLVKQYNSGLLTPDELFCRYYSTTNGPTRLDPNLSPWEISIK